MLHKPDAFKSAQPVLKVLVSANDPAQANAFEEAFNISPDFVVRTTSDAREISPLFSKWHFDILFLDMNMAHLPGTIVLAHFDSAIKAREIAIIAMAKPDDFAMFERALILGAHAACPINMPPADALSRARIASTWLIKNNTQQNYSDQDDPALGSDVIKTMPFSMLG